MGFNTEQQLQIKNYFESGKYGIIARTAGLRKDKDGHLLDASGQLTTETGQPPSFCVDWHMVTEPEWRWEKYEYRAYAVVNTAPDTEWIDPLFVFGYGYKLYYNEWTYPEEKPGSILGTNMYDYSFDTVNLTSIFDGNVAIAGDFQALGANNVVGTGVNNNTTLKVVGQTYPQGSRKGPKLRFENANGSNYVDLVYTDKGSQPTLTLSSSSNNEVLMLEREKVTNETVSTETVENMTATNVSITNLEVTNMTLRNVADVLYPVGSYYWSTDYTEPSKLFGGTWVQITNAFLFASTFADATAKTAVAGESHHTLMPAEVPTHNHGITDYGHSHTIHDPGHSHSVSDPGHMHSLRTIGDDYNGSGRCGCQWGTGNLVQDGWIDMSGENWRRGIWANGNTTGITVYGSYSNISINGNTSGLSINYSGGGQPHNNMPPYIRAYCWHRIG